MKPQIQCPNCKSYHAYSTTSGLIYGLGALSIWILFGFIGIAFLLDLFLAIFSPEGWDFGLSKTIVWLLILPILMLVYGAFRKKKAKKLHYRCGQCGYEWETDKSLEIKKTDKQNIEQPKKKSRKWLWILGGVILFLILISLTGGEKDKTGSTQIFQPSIKKEVRIPLDQKVVITSMKKGFRAANYYAGEFQDFITFEITFENKTNKDIRGAKGIVSLYDIFNEKIMDVEINYDKGIDKNSQKIWNIQIEFNPFIDSDVKLKNTEGQNLSYKWKPTVVIYEDGTREE